MFDKGFVVLNLIQVHMFSMQSFDTTVHLRTDLRAKSMYHFRHYFLTSVAEGVWLYL